ncbi:hypothetical protein K435DRAFT_803104 [Dendrothele bispora CBS 962.96]|uniref:Uncharacterized protein n=1 Tax=Dendrothele bispora (strain CBS 962.96) TaxID=1314807 RepID=A0A4S8LIN1_DENBC|nr:hypothetical protein K435DRAFT_803104 [Dendrothele bispora CBS 962.96]
MVNIKSSALAACGHTPQSFIRLLKLSTLNSPGVNGIGKSHTLFFPQVIPPSSTLTLLGKGAIAVHGKAGNIIIIYGTSSINELKSKCKVMAYKGFSKNFF